MLDDLALPDPNHVDADQREGPAVADATSQGLLTWMLDIDTTFQHSSEETLAKKLQEIMQTLESFDLTQCQWSAAQLLGCDPKTVGH